MNESVVLLWRHVRGRVEPRRAAVLTGRPPTYPQRCTALQTERLHGDEIDSR